MSLPESITENIESNEAFKEYATATAFSLTLSKNMTRLILALDSKAVEKVGTLEFPIYIHSNMSTFYSLQRRGLVVHIQSEWPEKQGWELTEAGELVAKLLRICDL